MRIHEQVQLLGTLEKAEIGRGATHPVHPNSKYAVLLRQHLEQFPFLRDYPDYVEFLAAYAGARVYSPERMRDGSFLHATIYGIGNWEFAEECPPAVTPEGFFVFSVVEVQPPRGKEAATKDTIVSYAFPARNNESRGVFVAVHALDGEVEPFRLFCSSFSEWLELFVRAKGWLLPSVSS